MNILKKSKAPVNTLVVVDRFYCGAVTEPFNARLTVSSILRQLRKKAVFNKENWKIMSSERKGPHPVTWWIE